LVENSPTKPIIWFVESNYSGDKKAAAVSFNHVRGKKVSAEVHLTKEVVEKILRCKPEDMVQYWQSSTIGVIQSGSIGAQGHVANGLTALFIATGQDIACISEASVGITRMELTSTGGVYVSVTLPNLIVGTVGGGTSLPTDLLVCRWDKTTPIALVLGNETDGVDQSVLDVCDNCIEIPQFGTKHSFNVSVCTGIVLWALCQ
jgi:hydroxymethylglutaryl-CoA reductase